MREFPLAVDNSESNVLVGGASAEMKQDSFVISWLLDNFIGGGFRLVNEIRVEDVELGLISDAEQMLNLSPTL